MFNVLLKGNFMYWIDFVEPKLFLKSNPSSIQNSETAAKILVNNKENCLLYTSKNLQTMKYYRGQK